MKDVRALEYREFYVCYHDAIIYNLEQTEQGREYLQNAWRIDQTDIDEEAFMDMQNTLERRKNK